MRRISPFGTVKLLVVVAVTCNAALQLGVAAWAEDRSPLAPRVNYNRYAAPTPRSRNPDKRPVDANTTFVAKVKQGSFALVLNDGNRYIWMPSADRKLPLETAFASVEVPLALVASVSFSDEQGAVKVTFRNGDMLTGKLLLKELAIRTAYGDLTVPISAMTFLGAGGVTTPATRPLPQQNTAASRYSSSIAPPPRPAPAARFDKGFRR